MFPKDVMGWIWMLISGRKDEVQPLMTEVEEIAQKKLASDIRLEHIRGEQVYSEVMQELER